ncbi:DNA methyltransferase [Enterococcus faecalis]|uniref:DNA methyltransferase n=1 Tax=Enterococcus faecalis TaxID=1351 RepID=UPI002033143E|nr:DNA methyltransferase [Enterococcus faecalis]MDT2218511.1 DNA methyltransferase [Enterococcus faecalis]
MDQGSLFEKENKPVECLGMTFKNDDERREYFRNELRKKLPDLKNIEGFPIGEDEDIIELSDPPYYTACPNPWLNDFILQNKSTTKSINSKVEPYYADVSEGKNDKIYMAHAYHTKVPYKAIMKYILHYTEPGETVLDAFCGTGMTALACYNCGDEKIVSSLSETAQIGQRHSIISDLSPAATFISSNFLKNFSAINFQKKVKEILIHLENELGDLFKTNHLGDGLGDINYTIWSEVYNCPNCSFEYDYYSMIYDETTGKELREFSCPNCGVKLNKALGEKIWTLENDLMTGEKRKIAKMIPVSINYTYQKNRFLKKPDKQDIEKLNKARVLASQLDFHPQKLPGGVNSRQPEVSHGFKYLHDFYSSRNLLFIYRYIQEISKYGIKDMGMFLLTASMQNSSFLYRWRSNGKGGILSGTLYICSTPQENNIMNIFKRKLKDISYIDLNNKTTFISINSATNMGISSNSIDYIFTDPPFGANLNYSELNFLWEGWLNVFSNNKKEAIVNSFQNKNLNDYHELMYQSFKEYYRVLKPDKWITIEFSNSQAAVWNSIQDSIQKAGFIIANVAALDKKQGSFKAVTSATAVKQDLVITAYKPSEKIIKSMREEKNVEQTAWLFLEQHLNKLPIFQGEKNETIIISERTPRILFDRMIAYHIQSNLRVPISSADFQEKIAQKYVMRDGMVFLESQVAEYDKKRILAKEFSQQSLFVSDEGSAIEWLRQQLMKKPQSRQDIHPQFMKEIQYIAKHEELPELDNLLAENFLLYDSEDVVPDQIAAYLRKNYHDMRGLENQDDKMKSKAKNRWYVPDPNKQADLEKLREKSLLREFNHYVEEVSGTKKKLKLFRSEAIRAGFKQAWSEKDYQKIVDVAEYLPEKIIQEDDKLLMFHTHALMRLDI